jgi:hypothetical protein
MKIVPNFEERIMTGDEDDLSEIARSVSTALTCVLYSRRYIFLQLRQGATGARGDDTKTLKGSIIEWITLKGQVLDPPLYRNQKVDRGFHHERTGALLCPIDLDWSKEE